MDMQSYCIIVSGPTGVGKTAFVDALAATFPVEIINGDMGQMYTPLTIGTAKPHLQSATIPHHLFNIVDKPELFTVSLFRIKVKKACEAIWERKKIPIIVGGSSFYITALFFPPVDHAVKITKHTYDKTTDLWQELNEIDPERAHQIEPTDTYRLQRALNIWHSTGQKPSLFKSDYNPISRYLFIWLVREREELYARINKRVIEMIDGGWIAEVQQLLNTDWEQFLLQKKILGYSEIIAYCREQLSKEMLITTIQTKTRNYAKRQITYFRMLLKKLEKAIKLSNTAHKKESKVEVLNLTHDSIDSYIKQLKSVIPPKQVSSNG